MVFYKCMVWIEKLPPTNKCQHAQHSQQQSGISTPASQPHVTCCVSPKKSLKRNIIKSRKPIKQKNFRRKKKTPPTCDVGLAGVAGGKGVHLTKINPKGRKQTQQTFSSSFAKNAKTGKDEKKDETQNIHKQTKSNQIKSKHRS